MKFHSQVVESSSLEIFKGHLDIVSGNLLELGVGPDDIQRSLPASTIVNLDSL